MEIPTALIADRYQITELLGEGGMAFVYKARDTHLDNDVAVKVIRTERLTLETMEKTLRRFEREAKALAQLTHPSIVKVSDYGDWDGKPYLVMTYLKGGTLEKHLGTPMPYQQAARLLAPVAHALAYAHEHHIIHRDVKPTNILLTEKGLPMLSDFGIAKIISEEATVDLTGTSATVGTPEYMSPEQSLGKKVDYRCDIYSLGIVFYELVTGRKPFLGNTPIEIVFKHIGEPLPPPTQFIPGLPAEVERVMVTALAKKPEERYQNMADFATALEHLSGVPTSNLSVPVVTQGADDKTANFDLATGTVTMAQPPSIPMPPDSASPRKKMPTGGKIALGAVGLCLLLVVCLGAGYAGMKYFGYDPASLLPSKADNSPKATLPKPSATGVIAQSTNTFTPVPPTSTPVPPTNTPNLVATQTARAAAAVAEKESEVKSAMSRLKINTGSGHLAWTQTKPVTIEPQGVLEWDNYAPFADGIKASDFVVGADITWTTDHFMGCGIVFRSAASNGSQNDTASHYVFYYQNFEGLPGWHFSYFKNGDWNNFITDGWRWASAINQVRGSTNKIILAVNGNTFTLYINGERIGNYFDYSNSLTSGYFAAVAVRDTGDASCKFDNGWVWIYK
jgi:serine/threonine protein kinase